MKRLPSGSLWLALGLSLTLGLAPFRPEPHLVGKLRWVWGGAVGMGPMDWFDLGLHGLPWVWLAVVVVLAVVRRPPDPALVKRLRVLLAATEPPDVELLAAEWGVDPDEVAFLVSAVGSWRLRNGAMKGLKVSYDARHREVFRAMDHLTRE